MYAGHADRQTAAGKRPSITAPCSLSPPKKGDERRWWLRQAACTPTTGKGHGMQHPRGGFGCLSAFLGSGDAAWMGNPKGEVWDALLGTRNGMEKWDCVLGGVCLMPPEMLRFWKCPKYFVSGFS